ncbi:MAG: sigma 54-interacting transcriptional regulator [Thermodesulfobacteriota bacterium]
MPIRNRKTHKSTSGNDEPHREPHDRKDATTELELLRLIIDNIYHGAMITDADGFVTHFNAPYGRFLGVEPSAQLGKHCSTVVENSRMHLVAKSGQPEINYAHRIKGHDMVVQRIPIMKAGKVTAVFGQVMFKDIRDVSKLARKLTVLESKVELYEQEIIALRSARYTMDSIVGVSDSIHELRKEALKAAATHLPVLVTGESGTGKELFAQAIHHASARRLHPFVRINCAAIPRDLMESELFGYEQGAFTGALAKGKPGKFELAHHGTVFLDEIGDLPLDMQPKLLRVLEEKEFERVGGTSVIPVDFRLIAATNQNLEQMIDSGRFRRDLFYRLNVIPLRIPPLRERREDVMPLAHHLLDQIATDVPCMNLRIDPQAERMLRAYDWPGNARELANVLERIVASLDGDVIYPRHLPFPVFGYHKGHADKEPLNLSEVLARAEAEAVRSALTVAKGNKAKAAKLLGIHRTHLYKKMKKHGMALC